MERMRSQDSRDLDPNIDFEELKATLLDIEAACHRLPEADKRGYERAQQSVVDARRSAETHEGLLQIC